MVFVPFAEGARMMSGNWWLDRVSIFVTNAFISAGTC